MKPIETFYRDYRFRSRLEARWAVFFDTLGIPWEYEKEGYDLDGVYYLPDFWLPMHRYWVEIKGEEPTDEELDKCKRLFIGTGYPTIVFHGVPAPEGYAYFSDVNDSGGGNSEGQYNWVVCRCCGKVDMNFRFKDDDIIYNQVTGKNITYCTCPPFVRDDKGIISDANRAWEHPRLIAAYTAAKQARFEHGERP